MNASDSAKYDFFISYTQSDLHWAEWIGAQLEAAGYRIVIQAWDFAVGKNFVLEMDEAIKRSRRTLAVLSSEYLRSAFAASEWAAAFAADATGAAGKLVPVRVADVVPAGLLAQIFWIDIFNCDEDTARERLLQAASAERLKPSRPPGFPGGRQTTPMFPAGLSPIWNVPARNTKFAGRQDSLNALATAVAAGGQTVVTQAIAGLGGIGKSQLAIEYAYRHAGEYRLVWWVRAETPASRTGDLLGLAHRLFEDSDRVTQEDLLNRLRIWLSENDCWLLIFDNVESAEDLINLVPTIGFGQVIVTSRHRVWDSATNVIDLSVWSASEASEYLMNRTDLRQPDDAMQLVAELGYLPLAVEQAAAYIDEAKISIAKYLSLFRASRATLLDRSSVNAKVTVSSIWNVSLKRVAARSQDAVTLLQLIAFLPPDGFPRSELSRRVTGLPGEIADVVSDDLVLNAAVATLRSYSLIEATPSSVSVHRLVQVVIQDGMTDTEYRTFTAAARQIQFGGLETGLETGGIRTSRGKGRLAFARESRILKVLAAVAVVFAASGVLLLREWLYGPIPVSFNVYYDLSRKDSQEDIVKRSNTYLAIVIYGSRRLDVRDVNEDSVYLTDGTGSGVAPAMFHRKEGYDENNDGRDDLKIDYKIDDLKTSANELLPASTFYISGRLNDAKAARPIRGERAVTIIP